MRGRRGRGWSRSCLAAGWVSTGCSPLLRFVSCERVEPSISGSRLSLNRGAWVCGDRLGVWMVWEPERLGGGEVSLIFVVGLDSVDASAGGWSARSATSWLACCAVPGSGGRLAGRRGEARLAEGAG
jgi:hypothetical protein